MVGSFPLLYGSLFLFSLIVAPLVPLATQYRFTHFTPSFNGLAPPKTHWISDPARMRSTSNITALYPCFLSILYSFLVNHRLNCLIVKQALPPCSPTNKFRFILPNSTYHGGKLSWSGLSLIHWLENPGFQGHDHRNLEP